MSKHEADRITEKQTIMLFYNKRTGDSFEAIPMFRCGGMLYLLNGTAHQLKDLIVMDEN